MDPSLESNNDDSCEEDRCRRDSSDDDIQHHQVKVEMQLENPNDESSSQESSSLVVADEDDDDPRPSTSLIDDDDSTGINLQEKLKQVFTKHFSTILESPDMQMLQLEIKHREEALTVLKAENLHLRRQEVCFEQFVLRSEETSKKSDEAINELFRDNEKLRSELEEKNNKMTAATKMYQTQMEALSNRARVAIDEFKSEWHKQKSVNSKLVETQQELKKNLETSEQDQLALKRDIHSKIDVISGLRSEKDEWNKERSEAKTQIQQIQAVLDCRTEEKLQIEKDLRKATIHLDMRQRLICRLGDNMKVKDTEIAEKDNQISSLHSDKQRLESDLAKANAIIKTKEEECLEKTKQLSSTHDDLVRLTELIRPQLLDDKCDMKRHLESQIQNEPKKSRTEEPESSNKN